MTVASRAVTIAECFRHTAERYADRVAHIHLKDLTTDPLEFRPLGAGVLDFPEILRAVREAGYESWLMVELDAYDGDPREAAEHSRAYLDKLLGDASP